MHQPEDKSVVSQHGDRGEEYERYQKQTMGGQEKKAFAWIQRNINAMARTGDTTEYWK